MFDYLIVGSGLSSIAAALELKDLNLAIVDVGDKKMYLEIQSSH